MPKQGVQKISTHIKKNIVHYIHYIRFIRLHYVIYVQTMLYYTIIYKYVYAYS